MSTATLRAHDALLPRAPGGQGAGAAISLVVHVGLIAALSFSVDWQRSSEVVIAAELWASVPQTAAPPAVQKAPEPAPPPPPVRAEPPPPPPRADAQIATEKARKEQAARERAEQLEKEKTAREAKEKLERDKREQREKREQEADEKRLAQQREENLRRMMGQVASADGSTTSRGTASVDAAPSKEYVGRLVAAIFPNIVVTDTIAGNPVTEVEVRTGPNGSIIGRRIVKPSGNKDWDDAVLKAIDRTATLPRDTDGRVPPALTIAFRPQR